MKHILRKFLIRTVGSLAIGTILLVVVFAPVAAAYTTQQPKHQIIKIK